MVPEESTLAIVSTPQGKYVGLLECPDEHPDATSPVLIEPIQFETSISPSGQKIVSYVAPPYGVPEEIVFPNNSQPIVVIAEGTSFGLGYVNAVKHFKNVATSYIFTEKK